MNSAQFGGGGRWPIIAILRGIAPREAPSIGECLIDSGIRAIEVPLNSPCPFDSIRRLSTAISGSATIGAGTVLCVDDVKRVAEAGGNFVVSPNTDPDVIHATLQAGLNSMPGVLSPSEAFTAIRAGAGALKIFPASVMGSAYIRDLKAILPESVSLIAVGGVDLSNVSQWFGAGANGVGIGSALYKPGDTPTDVARKARAVVQAIELARRDSVPAAHPQQSGW